MTPDEFIDALERLVRSTAYEYARSTAYEYAASETAPDHPHWFLDKARAFLDELGYWCLSVDDEWCFNIAQGSAEAHEIGPLSTQSADAAPPAHHDGSAGPQNAARSEPAGPDFTPSRAALDAVVDACDMGEPWQHVVLVKAIRELQDYVSAQVSGGVAGSTPQGNVESASAEGAGSQDLDAGGESGPEPERITLWRHGEGDTGTRLLGETLVVVPAKAYDRAVKVAGEWRKMFFDMQDRLLALMERTGTRG